MNKYAAGALAVVIVFGTGFYTAKRFSPSIKTETIEKVVEKEVIKKDIQVVTRIIKDGKVIEETTTTDKSTLITDKKTDKKDITIIAAPKLADWHISIATNKLVTNSEALYQLQIERRILGNIFVGGNINTKNTHMLTLGMEF